MSIYLGTNEGLDLSLNNSLRPRLLVLDMPVRWNSTYDMINTAYMQESPITAVCASQTIDLSIRVERSA
jgi:hypothetical protein